MKTSGKKIYQHDDIKIIHKHYNKIAQPYQRLVRLGFLYAYASEIKTLIIIINFPLDKSLEIFDKNSADKI